MTDAPEARFGPAGLRRAPEAILLAGWLAVVAGLFATTFGYEFVWDDALLLERSGRMTDASRIADVFGVDFFGLTDDPALGSASPYYRPIPLGLIVLERSLPGDWRFRIRAVHAALHLANALLVFLLVRRFAGARGALLGAAAFSVLPYAVDTVLLAAGVADVLVLFFGLLAAIAFSSWLRIGRWWLAAVVALCSLLGMLSKENGIAIPVILLLLSLAEPEAVAGRRIALGIGISAAAIAMGLAARLAAHLPLSGADLGRGISILPAAVAVAARFALAPIRLTLEVDVDGSTRGPVFWVGLIGLVLFALAAARVGRRHRGPFAAAGIWLAWGAPALLAVAWTGTLAPRYLYAPALGLALGIGFAVRALPRAGSAVFAAWILACGALAAERVAAWQDSATLFGIEIGLRPGSAAAALNLANSLREDGDMEQALRLNLYALELAEARKDRCLGAFAASNAGMMLAADPGQSERAEGLFERAAAACPERASQAWLGLARLWAREGRLTEAERAAREALRTGPPRTSIFVLLGALLAAEGKPDESVEWLERARRSAGADPEARRSVERSIETVARALGRGNGDARKNE